MVQTFKNSHVGCFVCFHVFRAERPVRFILRTSDGAWQLLCGEDDHPEKPESYRYVRVEHIHNRQPDIEQVASMPPGFAAEFDLTLSSWMVRELTDEEDAD